jgi:hypothetical protein
MAWYREHIFALLDLDMPDGVIQRIAKFEAARDAGENSALSVEEKKTISLHPVMAGLIEQMFAPASASPR